MNKALNISFPQRLSCKPYTLFIAAQVFVIVIALRGYLEFLSLNVVLGAAALVFVLQNSSRNHLSNRFGWVTCIFLLLGVLMPVKTILFASVVSAILFLIESNYGKTGILALPAMALMSPVFQYLVDVFSFPIRLQLTRIGAAILDQAGIPTLAKGNMIISDGDEFSVDPGCMGLSMMQASLLLGIMLIASFERKLERRAGPWYLLSFFTCIVLLNIISNLSRIVLLVQLKIMPDTFAHHFVGLVCLLVYVFIPGIWLARWFVKRSRAVNTPPVPINSNASGKYLSHSIALICTALLAVYVAKADTYKKVYLSEVKDVHGFNISQPAPGIVKLENQQSMIYIKYIRGFYDTDHNPMICWKGSGYEFQKAAQETVNGHSIYTGQLTNNGDSLHTAWWYTDGGSVTTSQLQWRWDMLRTRKIYALVNVTGATKEGLANQIKKIMNDNTLSSFFTRSVYH